MRIVYMGTPDFAVPALRALCEAGHDVALVVCKPDRPKDRGKKLQSCPVKLAALELGLEVETPEKLKGNEAFFERLRAIAPDFIVVAAYGKILPKEVLDVPRYGCLNIHGSLLPKYRGAAPIHRAVINGEKETGVTLMYMEEGLDTGAMLAKASTPVAQKTTEELYDELSRLGADLLVENLPKIAAGELKAEPQDDSLASYAPMVFKEDGIIDFSRTAHEICCLVRGFNSWPVASTRFAGQVMKVYMAEEGASRCAGGSDASGVLPGTVLSSGKRGIEVSCGDGSVLLTKIQLPGGKALNAADWLRGHSIENGTVLG